MPKPNPRFEYIRADEVAECWDGVSKPLYAALWNVVMKCQKSLPNMEDTGPMDHVGSECVAKYWDKFSESEQAELNALAERN